MPTNRSCQSFANDRIRLWLDGVVATIELHQPGRKNAMSQAMWAALPDIVSVVEENDGIRVVLLRGAGNTFCAGADISEFAEVYSDGERTAHNNHLIRKGQFSLRHLKRPTIAVIEGACVGGGCGLALACDLRFAGHDARFAITPARLGLAYSFADTAQLVEKVGPARAKDMLFSGRFLDADEALAIGLIDRVTENEKLAGVVAAYADELAAMSQVSIRSAKAMINALTEPKANAAMDNLSNAAFEGADFQEGYQAFLEKRKPVFK